MPGKSKALMKALEWVVALDTPALVASVAAERDDYPELNNNQLAAKGFAKARWRASTTGAVTGLVSNPWVALPAATLDTAVSLRTETVAAARTAIIYDENFFDDENAEWELLIPVFGIIITSQFFREIGLQSGKGLTRASIRKYLATNRLDVFKKTMLKYFGMKVTQKGLITKTLPIVGGMIGGCWNYIEVGRVKNRSIKYFQPERQEEDEW